MSFFAHFAKITSQLFYYICGHFYCFSVKFGHYLNDFFEFACGKSKRYLPKKLLRYMFKGHRDNFLPKVCFIFVFVIQHKLMALKAIFSMDLDALTIF